MLKSLRVVRSFTILFFLPLLLGSCSRGMRPRSILPGEILEYQIPWDNAFPSDVLVDSTGLLWFTDRVTHRIASFDYRKNRFRSYKTPTKKSAPYGMALDPDGSIWFAESVAGAIGHLDPRTKKITEFVIPNATGGPEHIGLSGGRIWFALRDAKAYGWLDPRTGKSEIISTPFMKPYSVAVTPDGTVWMSAYDQWMLLKIDGRTGTADTLRLPRAERISYSMRRLAAGADGRVWITSLSNAGLTSFTPSDATMRKYSDYSAYGITVDTSGIVWFSEPDRASVIALNPATPERRTRQMTTRRASVRNITVDLAHGRAWLPMSDRGRIGLILLDNPKR